MSADQTLTAEAAVDDAALSRPPRRGAPGPRGARWRRSWSAVLAAQIAFVLVLGGLWQWLASAGIIQEIYVSRPTLIVKAFYNGLVNGPMLSALGSTLWETIAGFVIASVVGIGFGVLIYELPFLERTLRPFLTAANNLPRLALTPLFVLWLGVGFRSHVALVISMVFFVVLLNTYAGFQSTDRDYLLLARVLGASRWRLFREFMFPAAVPAIFVGLQLGLTYSFMGAVIAEIITGGKGLGALIATYSSTYDSASVFALLLLMALVATALSMLVRLLERFLLRWRVHEQRGLRNA